MKSLKLLAALILSLVVLAPASLLAQTNAYDDAYHYSHASATWALIFNGTNSGFGFTAWMCATSGPSSHGFFSTHNVGTAPAPTISSPTNCCDAPGNNNSQHVWGLFANGAFTPGNWNQAIAYRGFSNSLTTSDVFKIQWQNDGIGSGATNFAGFNLRNGNATNGVADLDNGLRFRFYYIGGGTNSFVIFDGNGPTAIGLPFTSTGLNCEFSLKTADTYRFQVKNAVNGNLLFLIDDQPLAGSGTLNSVALFAQQTSGNQEFNRMQISSTSLVAPNIVNVAPVNGIYINPGTSNVSFEVDSLASTVSTNTVTLLLNGVPQQLAANTTGATNQLLATNVTALAPNLTYTATIIAADANGNKSTNTFSFNTWRADNPFIEAEDYNFNSGGFIAASFPNPFGAYGNLYGTNGIDYLETDLTGTNLSAVYRPGDLPQIQAATDADHAGYAAGSVPDYNLAYTQFGEWENYTRVMSNTTYAVYARMASFGGSATMSVSHLANPTATSSNQPNVSLGTCVAAHTGGSQVYDFTQLKDFFSNPVLIKFPGTNTFRCTVVGDSGSYNLSYLIFVPVTNSTVLKPYLSYGYPYPAAAGVALDTGVSFSIANRETAVNPASIQVSLNGSNITSGIVLSNNAAGTVVTYALPNFLLPNVANTLTAIYNDTTGTNAPITNTWTFTTANSSSVTLPANIALPVNAGTLPGFAERIYKIDDTAPTIASIAIGEATLAGARTNTITLQPYPNLANGGPNADGGYSETNVINYDINAQSTGVFPGDKAFPYVPANAQNNNLAMEALMYLQLTAGNHVLVIRSDDGFKLTAGPTPNDTNFVVGLFDGGRGNGTPSLCYVTAPVTGLYPMRLMYYQAGSGGSIEFYSLDGGNAVLINDTNAAAFKSFQTVSAPANPVTLLNPARSGNTVTFSFVSQAGHTHYVEFKNQLTDANWSALTTISGSGSSTNVTDSTATNVTRFYRVRSQ